MQFSESGKRRKMSGNSHADRHLSRKFSFSFSERQKTFVVRHTYRWPSLRTDKNVFSETWEPWNVGELMWTVSSWSLHSMAWPPIESPALVKPVGNKKQNITNKVLISTRSLSTPCNEHHITQSNTFCNFLISFHDAGNWSHNFSAFPQRVVYITIVLYGIIKICCVAFWI